jgi:hypothetical protein
MAGLAEAQAAGGDHVAAMVSLDRSIEILWTLHQTLPRLGGSAISEKQLNRR